MVPRGNLDGWMGTNEYGRLGLSFKSASQAKLYTTASVVVSLSAVSPSPACQGTTLIIRMRNSSALSDFRPRNNHTLRNI